LGTPISEVTTRLKLRARFDKPGTIARMSGALVSLVDAQEAYALGQAAAELVALGQTDQMLTLIRDMAWDASYYAARIGTAPLGDIANTVRFLPDEFIGPDGISVTDEFRRYALPLLGPHPFPAYGRILGQQVSGVGDSGPIDGSRLKAD
jgi:6-phosphofructokinase 1